MLGVEKLPAGTYGGDGDHEVIQAGAFTGSANPTRSPESDTALLQLYRYGRRPVRPRAAIVGPFVVMARRETVKPVVLR